MSATEFESSRATEQWYASRHEEDWTNAVGPYPSWDEAAQEGGLDLDLEPGESYWVGQKEPFVPSICGTRTLERMVDDAHDHVGDHVGDWPNCTVEQVEELGRRLTATLLGWLHEFGLEPGFFGIGAMTHHTCPGEREEP